MPKLEAGTIRVPMGLPHRTCRLLYPITVMLESELWRCEYTDAHGTPTGHRAEFWFDAPTEPARQLTLFELEEYTHEN